MKKFWTDEEINDLIKDYGILTPKEMEMKYNRKFASIKEKCRKLNIKSNFKKKWNKEMELQFKIDWANRNISIDELKNKYNSTYNGLQSKAQELNIRRRLNRDMINWKVIIEEYNNGLSTNTIATNHKISSSLVKSILKDNKITMRESKDYNKKYNIDEACFDEIETEEKAYFLGFMYADGCNNTDKGLFNITLKLDDEHILNQFNKLLGDVNRPLIKTIDNNTNKEYSTLAISNRMLSNKLDELGVVKNKTFKIVFPIWIDYNLQRDFIRGYFDGDGSIIISKKRKSNISISLLGTWLFLSEIKDIILKHCNISNITITKAKPKSKIYNLRISGGIQVEEFLNYLYKDSTIYLVRKYNKYVEVINRSKDGWETRRKLYGSNGRRN